MDLNLFDVFDENETLGEVHEKVPEERISKRKRRENEEPQEIIHDETTNNEEENEEEDEENEPVTVFTEHTEHDSNRTLTTVL